MRPRWLPLLLLLAPTPSARAAEAGWELAGRAAWLLGLWVVVSIAATAAIAIWFRARARANERLSVEIRREDWIAASGAETAASRGQADRST